MRNNENLHQRSYTTASATMANCFACEPRHSLNEAGPPARSQRISRLSIGVMRSRQIGMTNMIQREIEAVWRRLCAEAGVPPYVSDDGLPGWLRDRIESMAVPVDRDLYFRDVVAALACRGWDRQRIMIEIAGRPWIPKRYAAGHALDWGVKR